MSAGKVDWNAIHRRVESITAMIDRGYSPGPEDAERILKNRAEMLAREPEEATDGESIEIVEFLLAHERYGIESRSVREVYPIKDYTPLPGTPAFVLGLVNVRGQIISVIDIKRFFGLPDKGIGDLNKVIIIRDDTMEFGILADSILGVRPLMKNEIQPPLPTLTGIREEFIMGVTGERIVVLDAGKLLKDKDIVVHQEI